jgi:Na+/pantothenate symporter
LWKKFDSYQSLLLKQIAGLFPLLAVLVLKLLQSGGVNNTLFYPFIHTLYWE